MKTAIAAQLPALPTHAAAAPAADEPLEEIASEDAEV